MAAEIPPGAYLKDVSPHINQNTIPHEMRVFAPLEQDTWARVVVSQGEVHLYLAGSEQAVRVTTDASAVIPADTPFRLEGTGLPVRFQLHYFHEPTLDDGADLAKWLAEGAAGRGGAS